MKSLTVVALSALTLAGSAAGADARGFRLRSTRFAVPLATTSHHDAASSRLPAISPLGFFDPRPVGTSIVTRSVMTTAAQGTGADLDEAAPIPPMPPAPTAAAVKKPAQPWCPSGRIAGAGTGFCLIN